MYTDTFNATFNLYIKFAIIYLIYLYIPDTYRGEIIC